MSDEQKTETYEAMIYTRNGQAFSFTVPVFISLTNWWKACRSDGAIYLGDCVIPVESVVTVASGAALAGLRRSEAEARARQIASDRDEMPVFSVRHHDA